MNTFGIAGYRLLKAVGASVVFSILTEEGIKVTRKAATKTGKSLNINKITTRFRKNKSES